MAERRQLLQQADQPFQGPQRYQIEDEALAEGFRRLPDYLQADGRPSAAARAPWGTLSRYVLTGSTTQTRQLFDTKMDADIQRRHGHAPQGSNAIQMVQRVCEYRRGPVAAAAGQRALDESWPVDVRYWAPGQRKTMTPHTVKLLAHEARHWGAGGARYTMPLIDEEREQCPATLAEALAPIASPNFAAALTASIVDDSTRRLAAQAQFDAIEADRKAAQAAREARWQFFLEKARRNEAPTVADVVAVITGVSASLTESQVSRNRDLRESVRQDGPDTYATIIHHAGQQIVNSRLTFRVSDLRCKTVEIWQRCSYLEEVDYRPNARASLEKVSKTVTRDFRWTRDGLQTYPFAEGQPPVVHIALETVSVRDSSAGGNASGLRERMEMRDYIRQRSQDEAAERARRR